MRDADNVMAGRNGHRARPYGNINFLADDRFETRLHMRDLLFGEESPLGGSKETYWLRAYRGDVAQQPFC